MEVEDPSDKVIHGNDGRTPTVHCSTPSLKRSELYLPSKQSRQEQIADLIKRGYLRKYVADRPPRNSLERRYGDNIPTTGNIQTIHGGFGSGGSSISSRKRHARSAFRLAEEEIYNLSSPYVGDQTPITFSNNDLRGLHLPHDDALVVSAVIANLNFQRILIDNGSSADILFISAFERMKIGLDKLPPFHTPLIGFGGNTTHPLGWINLPITLGTEPHQTTVWQDFIVVDCPSPYNAILGRPTLGGIKAITSTYHLKDVGDDIGVLRDEVEQLTLADPRETNNTKPLEEVVPISIHPDYPDCHIMIGTELTDELRSALVNFLKENSDIFAWSQGDVPGIDPEIAVHKLFIDPKYSPVRQKRRKFAPERLKVIEDEVNKLIRANVVREAHYPDWLANVESPPKKGESGGLVNKMFKEQIGNTMEVYIDDMLVKSLRSSDHIAHLEEAFSILRRHRMMLNPSSASLSVIREIYGFLVTSVELRLQWNEESENAFQQLKEYLGSPPLLTVPTTGEDLYIYLSISPTAHILQQPDTSGRLLKWSIELSEFHIEYKPRTAIKAQALADFIVESTHEDTPQPETTPPEHGCGAGLVIQAPLGEQMEYAIRMGFKATNNEAEYKALLAGLRVATELGAQSLEVFSDSQLVVNQVQGDYLAKDARMMAYLGERGILPKDKLQARRLQYRTARFGIPKVIISDNARQFDNDKFRLFFSDLAISHHFSSPGHPQANGQVKVTNRTILRNLKARLERSKSEWAEDLPRVLWAYHTTSRIPTGETPYSMVFGTESVIPVEIGMPNFRTSNFDKESNEVELRLNLDLLEEKKREGRATSNGLQVPSRQVL
ncbi:hypothetical protein Acr_00g0069240 [Actinidia rufa]|uniref:Integrase catalytic domain-containing protein n=1 Tax=Actinidia rufa TaxID=165716 RepID=A0A7J0DR30_9ERIC|nr:hypothetical protein Acr_00g0069240 [Actinidia rufa]